MEYVIGFVVWLAIGLVVASAIHAAYRGPGTAFPITVYLAVMGAFVGGMLGVAGYVYHLPRPLRPGGLVGATVGAAICAYLYHLVARRTT
ncbi:MAG: hypothetical protein P8099_06070 [Gemmatimonadota bacterium]|jgi:uncharacterized membrane protein YeaQ/YmgE (transglycosylase-associated protein family)